MVMSVPPLVIVAPAALPLGIQIASPVLSLAAVLTPITDRLIQSRFSFFDRVLTLGAVVGAHRRCRH